MLGVAQLGQVKDAINDLTLGATEPARAYRESQQVALVTFWDGRAYVQREYHSTYELPPGIRQVAEVVGAARTAESTTGGEKKIVWAEPDGGVCDVPEEGFDAETASRGQLMRRATARHLYPRQRRDLMRVYLRRFYDEKDAIDGYIKGYVGQTPDRR